MEVLKVLSERTSEAGYVLKRELIKMPDGEEMEMESAYNLNGDYIGDYQTAHQMCEVMEVKPELRTPTSKVCSIGFCEKEQKWYGWSHRAVYGFGIGSKTERGDCSYMPIDKEDFLQAMIRFLDEPHHLNTNGHHHVYDDGVAGVKISWTCSQDVPNEKMRGNISSSFQPYPESWGRGEWEAETLEEAKFMACDFAAEIS